MLPKSTLGSIAPCLETVTTLSLRVNRSSTLPLPSLSQKTKRMRTPMKMMRQKMPMMRRKSEKTTRKTEMMREVLMIMRGKF